MSVSGTIPVCKTQGCITWVLPSVSWMIDLDNETEDGKQEKNDDTAFAKP